MICNMREMLTSARKGKYANRAFPTVNASWLVEALGGKGNIVEITGLVGNPSDNRCDRP